MYYDYQRQAAGSFCPSQALMTAEVAAASIEDTGRKLRDLPWLYLNSAGQEYGPEPSWRMREWLTQGRFPIGYNLQVRLPEWDSHLPLHRLYQDMASAFVVPPAWPDVYTDSTPASGNLFPRQPTYSSNGYAYPGWQEGRAQQEPEQEVSNRPNTRPMYSKDVEKDMEKRAGIAASLMSGNGHATNGSNGPCLGTPSDNGRPRSSVVPPSPYDVALAFDMEAFSDRQRGNSNASRDGSGGGSNSRDAAAADRELASYTNGRDPAAEEREYASRVLQNLLYQ